MPIAFAGASAMRASKQSSLRSPLAPKVLPYNKEFYRQPNRVERFFNKLKHFRRIATRYDKLRKTFFVALHLVAAFLIIKNS